MKLIKISLIASIFFIFTDRSIAQNVKPQFKDFILVAYRVNDSTKKAAVTIDLYYHIDAQGMLHIIMNGRTLNGGSDANYNGLLRDTVYKLKDDIINKINMIFNGQKKLNSFFVGPLSMEKKINRFGKLHHIYRC